MIAFRRSAGTRVAAISAAVFLVASSTIGLAAVGIAQLYMRRALDDHVRLAAAGPIHTGSVGRAAVAALIEHRESRTGAQIGYALFDRGGRRIAGSLDTHMPPPGWHDIAIEDLVEGADPARALVTTLASGDRLVVAGNRRPVEMVQSAVVVLYLLAVAATAGLCLILAVVLSRYLDRKLDPITRTAAAIVEGRVAQRIPVIAVTDEFDAVSASLNLMLDHSHRLMDKLRQSTSDVAHDLRTPLTRARAELETALDTTGSKRDGAVAHALDHLDAALDFFAAILRVTEIEGGGRLKAEPVALDLLVADLHSTFAPVFEDGGGTLRWRADPDCLIGGDRALLSTLLINLLENVLRHAGEGASAVVTVARHEDRVVLAVADDGPGVPEHEVERIFERFVRLDGARGDGGFGLGLDMVRAVVEAHGASVRATRTTPGLAIVIDFDHFTSRRPRLLKSILTK